MCHPSLVAVVVLLLLTAGGVAAQEPADDRHSGYYYPEPSSEETYTARAQSLPDSDRTRRVAFVVELTQQMLKNPYPPDFVIFAKGADAEKLILVAMRDGVIDTLFRARALLAMLTSVARATPLFKDYGVADYFTFFDLLKILGFEQLTVSDGDSFAHQVTIE
ncbi:MAG: molybdopterin-guanine dinucleotide biosynthesis protein A [Geminicoccaceae bacterium]|nr:molybdopterin-guanine dinucleotide biosynthesis protein A [Geminicoccaceae bacterium]